MKLKKLLSGILATAVAVSTISMATMTAASAEDSDVVIYVTLDTDASDTGNEATYTISIVPNQQIGTLQMQMDFPEGLEYVADSFEVSSTAATELGWHGGNIIEWTEDSLIVNGYCLSAVFDDYTAGTEVVIGTFKATVADDSVYTPTLTYCEFTDTDYSIITYEMVLTTASYTSDGVTAGDTVEEIEAAENSATTAAESDGDDEDDDDSDTDATSANDEDTDTDSDLGSSGSSETNSSGSSNDGSGDGSTDSSSTDSNPSTGAKVAFGTSLFVVVGVVGTVAIKKRKKK
ncbi:MAG: hypothetical protein LIO41_06330 [Ruminococcus sp.]|nr:hypothetical protein [Ruminococcus sp.]